MLWYRKIFYANEFTTFLRVLNPYRLLERAEYLCVSKTVHLKKHTWDYEELLTTLSSAVFATLLLIAVLLLAFSEQLLFLSDCTKQKHKCSFLILEIKTRITLCVYAGPFPLDRNFWTAPVVFERVLKSPYRQKSA